MKKKCLLILFTAFAIQVHAQTQQQIDNQIAFTKIYGYVRYFHPSDEAAAIDWDKFSIYGISKVNNCPDRQSLKKALTDLFTPIAPTLQVADDNENVVFDNQQLIPPSLNNYKTIAWQHIGVGNFKYKEMPYQSLRTNRMAYYLKAPTNASTYFLPPPQPFARMADKADVNLFRNKKFVFQGRAKMASGKGFGHFWVAAIKKDSTAGFFNDGMNNRITATEWKDFIIEGTIDSNAIELKFGAILDGPGELLVDNINITINDGNSIKEIYTKNFNAEKTGIKITDLLSGEKKIKGPYFDYYSYSIIEDQNSPGKKIAAINSTLKYPDAPQGKYEKHTTLFKAYPKVGEYITKNIGSGLKIIMPISLYGNDNGTYPIADSISFNKLKGDLNRIKINANGTDSLSAHVADIVIAWNLFQHFSPYLDIVKTDWQQDLKDALVNANHDQNASDFYKTLKKFTAKLQDEHINVSWTNNRDYCYPPINWDWAEGKLVITHVWDRSAVLKKGDIITAINNEDPKSYFEKIKQYISAATPGGMMDRARTESLVGEKGSSLQLSYLDADNKPGKTLLKRNLLAYEYNKLPAAADTIKRINNNVMYINIGWTNMKAIHKIMSQLQQSKTIICDLRNWTGDNEDINNFIGYLLTQKDTATHWMQIPHRIYPDREKIVEYATEGFDLKPAKPHLNAKIIFLIDGGDYSWAESYISIIEHYKLATLVGQPTAGTNGDVDYLNLPGGYTISYSGLKIVKLDGSQHQGVGTKPDIYVEKTIKGVRENRDEFLEKALEIAGN